MKVEKSNVQDIWPLRPLQEGMLFHYLQGGEAGQYLERLVLSIKGKIEDVLFEESWRIVFRHNDALRSIFKWEGLKQPVQLVLRSLKPPLAIYDFMEWAEPGERGPQYRSPQAFRHMFGGASAGNLERAQTMGELMDGVELEMKAREQETFLDLKEGAFRITLCKFRSECWLFLTFHHIVLDGWSLGIILEEWLTAYRTLALGQTPAKPMKTSFKSYLAEVKKNRDAEKEAGFWAGYLQDYEIKQNIQPFYPPQKQRFKRLSRRLPEKATALVRDMCADCGISAATFMYGVWGILLQRFKHAEDIVFGTTVSGRSLDVERIDTIAGLLINTIPLRIGSRDGERASAFFRRLHEELGARRPYELTGLKDIKTYGGFKGPEELFDTLVVFENYPLGRVLLDNPVPSEEGKGQDPVKQEMQGTYGTQGTQGTQEIQGSHGQLSICAYEMEEHTHYPLTLLIRENGSYELEFIYDTTVYEYFVVKQMSECFEHVLGSIARSPEQELSSLQIARADDLHMNTYLNNNTIREYPVDRTIAELFAVAMAGHADQTAIVHEEGVMTYRELDELSDLIAGELIRRGAGAEQCVGIQSHRSPEMIAGLLAVLKTGAAYVPIHPDYPQERKRYIAGDSGISILLGGSEADYPLYDSMGIKTLNLAGPWARSQVEDSALKRGATDIPAGERLACIVYTSGSTGQPKGIMIEQRGIIRLVKNTEFAEFRRSDVVLPTCPLEFDVSNFEIWGALLNGSTLCLISGEKLLMPRTLKESLLQHNVSMMWLTTPLFNQMARTEPSLFRSLRCLLVGGDALSPVCVNKVREACPGLVLINGYGPSENSVLSTTHRIEWNYDVRVPIGKPISNSTAYILDPRGKFLPVGAIGELCVGLDGVARGYLNKPELTHEKFVPDPVYPHGTMFKTGDLARWLPDGSIDFLGRADYQVKVRGYRLELQEIENELGQLEGMGACAVLVRSEPDREKELVAFMVSERKWTAAKARQSLLSRLPAYAVPTRFVQLEELPLTVNGKIDKKALLRLPLGPAEVAQAPSPVSMERMVLDIWKEVLGTDQIGLDDNFFDIGGNSLLTVQISDKLQKSTGFELSVTDLFRYPSIRELAGYLSNQRETAASAAEQPPRAEADNGGNGEYGGRGQAMQATSDIAIVGLSARLPGAFGIEEFWRNLEEGRESISFFSDEELRSAGIGESDWSHPDYVKAKGVLEDIEHFDAGLFDYSPHEAELMDPQLRILHECAWSCLENAGYDPGQYDKPIGLFVGASVNLHWVNHLFNTLEDDTERWRAANLNVHSLSMPVSYKLNLKGPSLTIETACSSSLVGVHLACRSLLDRECGMALAGGVSVTLPKKSGYHYQDGMIKSPDGHCRAFDAEAKGTVSGDGAGMVALKRLDDALADGDHIYAIIKGTAINNDGSRKVGFTAPSIEGQIEVVTAAQRAGAIPPESISYIEAHGTATPLGDPIEIEALSALFPGDGEASTAVGSVKTNIGHLDTAAGIAGLIKTVLALHHKKLPPSLNYTAPNPKIRFDKTSLYVNTVLKGWEPPAGYPRRAGVSSFGIGGTNAHVVLEEAPAAVQEKQPEDTVVTGNAAQLFLLSAATETALQRRIDDLLDYLDTAQTAEADLPDIAHSLQAGRKGMACRLAVIAATKEELVKRLREKQQEPKRSSAAKGESKDIIFVFPGQGSQYVGMAKEWYQSEPFFRQQVDHCLDIVSPMMRQDLRQIWFSEQLKGHLTGAAPSGESAVRAINHTETAQPLLFIVEYAAAQLLMHWGIKPAAMIGHSLGEYTAACISGVLSLEDALRLIVRRSALMQKMEPGCMVHVHMTQENVKSLLSDWPDLSIAAANSTEMTVVSGPEASIGAFGDKLKTLGHDVVRLQVSHAFHSAMMEPMLAEYREALYGISLSAPAIPYVSNVSGAFITPEMAMDPEYYAGHVRQTVNFKDGIAALTSGLNPLFIEVGPGQTLSQLIRANHHVTEEHPALHLLPGAREKRPAREILLQSLGGLWINGLAIDWSVCNAFKGSRSGKRIPLPTYPFEKEYYWSLWGGKEVNVRKEGGKDGRSPLADWFYIPQWTERHPVQTGSEDELRNSANVRRVLVLANQDLLSERVADALQRQGESCVRVYPGSGFARISAAAFTVDPGSAADYAALYAALRQEHGGTPDTIMHLWGVDESEEGEAVRLAGEQAGALTGEQTLVKGLYSLIYLLQAGVAEPTQELKLLLAVSGMERVNANEETHPLKSTLKGAASVIPLEYPNVSVCTLDLLPHEAAASAEMMLELLRSSGDQLDKVSTRYALRGSNCYQHSFAAADIAAGRPSGLKRHGVYLITGGLGGIGLALAGYLSELYQARLVLVSRTPRPVEHQLEDMRANGAQVLVEYGDVSDEASLERMIAAVVAHFGPLDGVFHAAGVPAGGMIHSTAKEEIAAALRPKLDGTLALHGVLAALQPQPAFLVLFSSISGSFGAFGQVGYAAANAFLDGFAQSHVESGQGMSVVSIDWDTWNETGMAVDSLKRYNGRNRRTEELPQLHLRIKHPLLAACSDAAWDTPFIQQLEGRVQRTYISRLSAAEHWVLDEHRMLGTPVLPGTAYIELIRACFEDLTGERGVAIQELFFLQPLLVDVEAEIRSVWVDHGSHWEFAVVAEGPDGNWIEHAKGRAARDKITSEDRLTDAELEGIQSRLEAAEQAGDVLRTPIAAEDASAMSATAEDDAATLQYGPRWDSLQGMYSDNSQDVARLSLGDRYREDLTAYVLHPALLDRATSFMDGQEAERSSYLPFAYKNVVIREPMTAEIYSLVTRQGEERGETLAFSCRIADPLGHVLADIGEFVMKRVSASPAPARISVDAISAAPVVGSYKLDISVPGDIESLHFKPVARRKPGPGEVEIAVAANGLNFKEVLYALGILKLPDSHQFGFGLECAGTVSAVGQGVTDLKPGDEVMALADASFGRYALALAGSVVRKPAGITFEEAATLPISYMTAYYALVKRGQLARGEKVLIHTATGGVGMAAIHIAKWIGAEIHATAGSMEKRDYLRSIGIEHVYPSRTLEFAEGIRKAAGSVDVVLNSLTGQAIEQGISLLAPHGRFLEMGVKDILENSQLGLSAFAQGASFTAINIGSHIPGYSDLFRDIAGHVEAGHFAPLPFVSYPLEDTKQAFQYMAAAKHIGKIVIAHHPKAALQGTGDTAAQLLNGMTNAEGLEVLERILSHACSAKAAASVQYLISTTALEQRLSGLEAGSIAGTAVNSPATSPASSRVRQRPTVSTEYSPPVTESEQRLSALVAEFLGLDKVGLHDNFFEIGATSLDMVQINTKVNALSGKDPSIVKMYSYPTVGLLNAYLFEDKQGSGDAAKETEQQKRKESRMKTLQSLKGGK